MNRKFFAKNLVGWAGGINAASDINPGRRISDYATGWAALGSLLERCDRNRVGRSIECSNGALERYSWAASGALPSELDA